MGASRTGFVSVWVWQSKRKKKKQNKETETFVVCETEMIELK